MNEAQYLKFEDIKIGLSTTFNVKVSEEMVDDFLSLSGDFNPLHSSLEFAQKTKFKKRVIPGMLLAGFFSRLIGMHIPGERSLYLSQMLNFKNPGFIGDEIVVRGEVTKLSETLKIITLATTIVELKSNKTLIEGEARALYL